MAAAPVPISTGPKWEKESVAVSHSGGMILGQVAKAPWHGVWHFWEATWRRWGKQAAKHTRAGRKGLFLPELAPLHGFVLGWLYTSRRRPSAAVDRGL